MSERNTTQKSEALDARARLAQSAPHGALNLVLCLDGEVRHWYEAFPRPEHANPDYWLAARPEEAQCS